MSHFAQINEQNLVTQVIVAEQDFIDTGLVGDPSKWIQTSYNSRGNVHYGADGQPDGQPALRKNYAGIGYTYDPALDAFIPPTPFPSWILDTETGLWNAPVPMPAPAEGKGYVWNEGTQVWDEVEIPTAPPAP